MAATYEAAAYGPSQTALLVLDFHNFVVDMIKPEAKREQVISSVSRLLRAARANNVAIAHGLIDEAQDPLPTSKMTARWQAGLKPMITSNPSIAAEAPELAPSASATSEQQKEIVSKRRVGGVSALKEPSMLKFLEERGIKSLLIVGISSSGCVVSAARDASDLGFVSTVVRDGCWDPSEETDKAVMDVVVPMAGWVVDEAEAIKLLGGSTA